MSNRIFENDCSLEGQSGCNANQIAEVETWLVSEFVVAGKVVPQFEYTPSSISLLHRLATQSQANTQAALIVTNDLHQKAAEYSSQAARIREILENVGLAQGSLSPNYVVSSTQVLTNVANLLNLRDTELSSFLIAIGDLSIRKTEVEEKRIQMQRESKKLLDHTRRAIARITFFKRILQQLEDDVLPNEAPMGKWEKNLAIMAAKETQYVQQHANFKELLNRVGYTSEISHRILVGMAEEKEELERKTIPIMDTLRSYKDLPPDTGLATLAMEDKTREYDAAEKYLEDLLLLALETTD